MAFSKKPNKKDYPNTFSGQRAYDKAMRKWKGEGTTRTNKRSLAKEEQIKIGGKWVDKADWTKKTEEALKIKPKFKNDGSQFTRSDTFAFKDKNKQKEYEEGLAKIKAKETSGVGPVKSGAEYAKKLKGTIKGVGPVKDGDTYAKGIKKSKTTKAQAKDTGGTSDSDKAAWLKRTRNSPAAKSGAFTDAERWALQKKKRLKIKNKGK